MKFSIKSNFTGTGDIRLINILGEGTVKWEEPTLFFVSGLGMCYADPIMDLKTKHTNDALVINVRQIKEMVKKNKKWLIPIMIPMKPKNSTHIKIASYDLDKSILDENRK